MRLMIHAIVFLVIVVAGGIGVLHLRGVPILRDLGLRVTAAPAKSDTDNANPDQPNEHEELRVYDPKSAAPGHSDEPPAITKTPDVASPNSVLTQDPVGAPSLSSSTPNLTSAPPAAPSGTDTSAVNGLIAELAGRRLPALIIRDKSSETAVFVPVQLMFQSSGSGAQFSYLFVATDSPFVAGEAADDHDGIALSKDGAAWAHLAPAKQAEITLIDWAGLDKYARRTLTAISDHDRHFVIDLDPKVLLLTSLAASAREESPLVNGGRVPFDPLIAVEQSFPVGPELDARPARLEGIIQLADRCLRDSRERSLEFEASVYLDEDTTKVVWSKHLTAASRRVEISAAIPKGTQHITLRLIEKIAGQGGEFPCWNAVRLVFDKAPNR